MSPFCLKKAFYVDRVKKIGLHDIFAPLATSLERRQYSINPLVSDTVLDLLLAGYNFLFQKCAKKAFTES